MLGELVTGGSTALEQITHDKLCCANFITLNLTLVHRTPTKQGVPSHYPWS